MKVFSRSEAKAVFVILAVIAIISLLNFKTALRRGRDNERENDMSDIKSGLDDYHTKFNAYPATLDGLSAIMRVVPKDPSTPRGYAYLYLTDGRYYQIFASLEGGNDESVYDPGIVKRNLSCGKFICSFGKSSGDIPLDKSIEEYENEIYAQTKK